MTGEPLREQDVDQDPFVQFQRWYDDALARHVVDPDAMIVATATPSGLPSARAVLLRGFDARGFAFFTSVESRKGREIDANPWAAVVFHWREVQRQVRATGAVEHVAREESERYWFNRPRARRISAWASAQSEPIGSRAELDARAREVEERFADGDVPPPPFWGGFRVVPDEFEFWQHRDDRLHDRLRYSRARESAAWAIERLQP
jgi:pyridoxamine 5'-phosphate oxidase